MSTVFIVHGVGGYPEENWSPWLKNKLEKLGYHVIVPQFPTPEGQTLENWLKTFESYRENLDEGTIFIGHSLGVAFLLCILESQKAKAFFGVSGFVGKTNNEFTETMKTFAERSFDWEKIKTNCRQFTVLHGDNDPYIPVEKAQELAEKLETTVEIIPNGGHLNTSAGFTTFELLLKKVLDV